MTDFAERRRSFDIGRVVNRTLGVFGANFARFALLAVVLCAIPQMGLGYLQFRNTALFSAGDPAAFNGEALLIALGVTFGAALVMMLLQTLLEAATVHTAVEDLKGRRASLGDAFRVAFGNLLPLIGLGLLQAIAVVIGFLLLIVPGVILSLVWAVTVPALVIERTGVFGAFSRSADLTRDHRGSIFLLALLYVVLILVVFGVMGALATAVLGLFASGTDLIMWRAVLVDPLINAAVAVVGSVGVSALYFELRWLKSSPDEGQELAAIFD